MSYDVHIVGPQFSSFVRSVMLACEEKGVSYKWGFQMEDGKLHFGSEQHLQLHPFGLVPALIHGDRTLFETGPICRYIDEVFGGPALQPADPYEKALVDQWSQAISTYVDKAIIRKYLLPLNQPKGEDEAAEAKKQEKAEAIITKDLAILSAQLGEHDFICGANYTIADALLTPMLDYLVKLPNGKTLLEQFPNLATYTKRMQDRDSGKAVLTTKTLG